MPASWAIPDARHELASGIYLRHIYYFSTTDMPIEVPCQGWQHGIIIPYISKATVFCPYTSIRYSLPITHTFVAGSEFPKTEPLRMLKYIKSKFKNKLTSLPQHLVNILTGESTPTVPTAETEFKYIKRNSKRGRFVQAILNGKVYLPILCTDLNMSRNNVLSYLYQIQKVNGIEYILDKVTDTVKLTIPDREIWQ